MRVAFKNFTGGEVSPSLCARYDLKKFPVSAKQMENFYPCLHGDVTRRPGMRHIADLGEKSVLIPFSFSVEASQNFIIILQDEVVKIATKDALFEVELTSPYTADELYEVSYCQTGDILWLTHPNHSLHKLYRTGSSPNYNWTLAAVQLNASISAPGTPTVTFERNNSDDSAPLGYTLRYKICAVDEDGNLSLPSSAGSTDGKHPSDWVVGNRVSISWTAVTGAVEYNVYREESGYFGFIGVSSGTSFIDTNYQADTADTPPEDWNPFANGNNPSTVCVHQQRLVLAGTKTEPQVFYMSRAGDLTNFRKSRPLQDDDPIEYGVASGSIDAIAWVASFGDLLLGTAGAEYKATGPDGIITAKKVQISTQSFWGSSRLAPLIIGNSILHVQRHGGRVRDMYYSLEKDGYAGNDLSILAPHLFEGHKILQWTYQQTPNSNVWCVREDGVLLCLTYLKEHEIFGWSRHTTRGKILSACSISSDDTDVLMLAVERTVNGETKYFLERLEEPFDDTTDIKDAFFVDCGIKATADEPARTFDGFDHLEGEAVAVLADGSPVEGLTVKDGAITIPYACSTVIAGLPYTSTLETMPVEADVEGGGSTLGKRRAYGRSIVRVEHTVGGKFGAFDDEMYEFPFLPERWGQACVPYTGDLEVVVPSAQRADTTFLLTQALPLPFHIVAVSLDVVFGEE